MSGPMYSVHMKEFSVMIFHHYNFELCVLKDMFVNINVKGTGNCLILVVLWFNSCWDVKIECCKSLQKMDETTAKCGNLSVAQMITDLV